MHDEAVSREAVGDELRRRAQQLRDNRDGWVQGSPHEPGQMCVAYNWSADRYERRALNPTTIAKVEDWLPSYILVACPDVKIDVEAPFAVTEFNDSLAEDVDDVIIMLEKAAAELG